MVGLLLLLEFALKVAYNKTPTIFRELLFSSVIYFFLITVFLIFNDLQLIWLYCVSYCLIIIKIIRIYKVYAIYFKLE